MWVPPSTTEPESAYWEGRFAHRVINEQLETGKMADVEQVMAQLSVGLRSGSDNNASFNINANSCDTKDHALSDASTAETCPGHWRRRGRRGAKTKADKIPTDAMEQHCFVSVTQERRNELVQDMEAGSDRRQKAIVSLLGSVLKASFEASGCRVVQAALEFGSTWEKERIVEELRGHVWEMIESPHANFVLQKVVEVLPERAASFVGDELATYAAEVARHRFGCRILCRLIEHHTMSSSTDELINELLLEIDQLIHHNFARHVVEVVLEHGGNAHRSRIAKALGMNAFENAKHRNASYVIEKALVFCSMPDACALASQILTDPDRLLMLAVHECGCHVVKAALKLQADCSGKAKAVIRDNASMLTSTKHGQRLFDELQLSSLDLRPC